MVDFTSWGNLPEFKLIDAAYLACNLEPVDRNGGHPSMVRAISNMLFASINDGSLPARETSQTANFGRTDWSDWGGPRRTITAPGDLMIKRADLKRWLEQHGMRPEFLFPAPESASLLPERKLTPGPLPAPASGQSSEERKLTPMREPAQKDDWFYVIRDCVREFEAEHGYTPSESKLWARLMEHPPKDCGVAAEKTKTRRTARLTIGGQNPLDRESFKKRYARLYPAKVAE